MRRFFGTDGIRGKAGEPPLDESTISCLGAALGRLIERQNGTPKVLLGGDTRTSTEAIASWMATALQGEGIVVSWGGVLPTPAVSYMLKHGDWDAGVVISASHNPAEDNGIKILDRSGEKLSDDAEHRIEALMGEVVPRPKGHLPAHRTGLAERYLNHLVASHRKDALAGLSVAVDCANGAAYEIAGELFRRLGASVEILHASPNGDNINLRCGATVPATVSAAVDAGDADLGLALDGDADRAILVARGGRVVDGDDALLSWAVDLDRRSLLTGRRVVATVMSNLGLERALAERDISLERSKVGDRYVWQRMRATGAVLGGEQSGHVICSLFGVTGDGLLTGSHLMAIAAEHGTDELCRLERAPQVLFNLRVSSKPPLGDLPRASAAIAAAEAELGVDGRVLVRYSGTEPKARVMIEGDDEARISDLAAKITAALEHEIGD